METLSRDLVEMWDSICMGATALALSNSEVRPVLRENVVYCYYYS